MFMAYVCLPGLPLAMVQDKLFDILVLYRVHTENTTIILSG